ncbi:MAG TPA: molybdopterin-dependent oxidoreductase [Candidatus Sulfopaludibacter sp.]|nr:molybdopterin-dependent oxidoreductase [Candidatus Sulfopaludibacter sp.]
MSDRDVQREMGRRTRRSLLTGGLAALVGGGVWEWIRTRREDDSEAWPLRAALRIDEQLWRDYSRDTRLARTFPRSAVEQPRYNGGEGMEGPVGADWKLAVEGMTDSGPLSLGMEDIRALPKVEMVTQLKCIEGWSRVIHWGGARFRDFVAKHATVDVDPDAYVGMATPDGGYYVGLDAASALHPQTLLCYEMNGRPLEEKHGAPLRLVIPVKYGIKNIKRIGRITYQTARPRDYWAEDGYDWYAGF